MNKLKLFLILLSLAISGCGDNKNEKGNIKTFEEIFWVEDYVKELDCENNTFQKLNLWGVSTG